MPEEAPKAAPEAAPAAPVEKQTNCLSCNKPIKKLTRYYRNGKFYCSKKCWRDMVEKAKTEEKK